MVYIQVEHIHSLFAELSTLRQNGWKRPEVSLFWITDQLDSWVHYLKEISKCQHQQCTPINILG